MGSMWSDARLALRGLLRRPGFSVVVILTVALGIGANTAIFSVVRAVLLKPLPYASPDELVVVWGNLVNRNQPKFPLSPPDLRDFQEQIDSFADAAGIFTGQQTLVGDEGAPELIQAAGVTPNFFSLMGVHPAIGRDFEPEDAEPIAQGTDPAAIPQPAVIMNYGLWQRRYGGDPGIVGRTIQVAGQTGRVVGILDPGFRLLMAAGDGVAEVPEVFFTPRFDVDNWPTRNNVTWWVLARLAPGVSLGTAQAEMDALSARYRAEDSLREGIAYRLDVIPLIQELTEAARPTVWALFWAVLFVLLIACANVSNLLLVRASDREREIAIRSALGGERGAILRQLLTESLVLALLGGMVGVLLAFGGIRLLTLLRPANLPRLDGIGVDATVLVFTVVATMAAAVLFGLLPALRASRPRLSEALRDRGVASFLGRQKVLRNGIVIVEVALSVVLLIGAGLMIRSFAELQRVELGFDPQEVLTFQISLPGGQYDQQGRLDFAARFRRELEELPGVQSATGTIGLSMEDQIFNGRYGPEEALTDESAYGQADYRIVLPDFFETLGTRLVAGREFNSTEFDEPVPSVIVDTELARIMWPDGSAVGKRMLIRLRGTEPEWVDVIGVVEHQRSRDLTVLGKETVYFTNTFIGGLGNLTWAVRSTTPPDILTGQIRDLLASIDPGLPISGVATLTSMVDDAMTGTRFALVLIGVFAVLALFLAFVGIYGVLSAVVQLRTPEIGVRMALGAGRTNILGLILRQGLLLTVIGLVAGIILAAWATRLIASLLVSVQPVDPVVFSAVAVLFILFAVLACLIPAGRATRVDPITALQEE